LEEGEQGVEVYELQYLLNVISEFNNEIPPVTIDGIFGEGTKNAVEAFQRSSGLPINGEVGINDWDTLYKEYVGIINALPEGYFSVYTLPYPGFVLRLGSQGESVTALQEYLNYIGNTYTSIPKTTVDGVFGPQTQSSVIAYKEIFGLGNQGIVSASTWNSITDTYRTLAEGSQASTGQFPGYDIE